MKTVGFFIRHFTERGTEVSAYDYAKYNEEILNNKSYILCFNKNSQKLNEFPEIYVSYPKFQERFEIIEINNFHDMPEIIDKYNLDFFYTQTHGDYEKMYMFENEEIWKGKNSNRICKTIKHCVFYTGYPQGTNYISISNFLNKRFNTSLPVIPLIASIPTNQTKNFREYLQIPKDAIVFGRYGGSDAFDIPFVHNVIKYIIENNSDNIYFLFMNTNIFYKHPKIIYLDLTTNMEIKAQFINTCDVMLHARSTGETFGLAVAEFSLLNKPVITCQSGDLEHIEILGDKAIVYRNENDLINIISNVRKIINSRCDWNAYRQYSPENVMRLFDELIFSDDKYKYKYKIENT